MERERFPRTRTYSRYVLPSNRHGFPVHFDVLRRFVTISRNGSEGVAASLVEGAGVPAQAASLNARFLRDIRLIVPTERGRYIPTPEAIRFVNAKSVSDEKARPILEALISSTWFAEIARSVLSSHPVMSEDQFLGELAIAAQTDKTKEEPALRVLLEYLVYAGIVTRDERGLSIGSGAAPIDQGSMQSTLGPAPPTEKGLDVSGWEMLQTRDFYIRVRSDPTAIDDLIDFLKLLKNKVVRSRGTEAAPSATDSGKQMQK